MTSRPIYCDCQATTPVDPAVLEAMLPYFSGQFGNPSSPHRYGWEADAAVETARTTLATAINATPSEIAFVSGATEANNLAIKGVAEAYLARGRHLIAVATEHRAVLEPVRYLSTLGFESTILPVRPDGILDLDSLEAALRTDTILVSVMAANNEIGVLQPLQAIGKLLRDRYALDAKPFFHSDAAQALGQIPLDVEAMGLDLVSMTAHKIYGPKGIGALYVRRRSPRVRLAPQLHGGGQERERRSGTLNPPLIVGFAKAVEIALERQSRDSQRLIELRSRLWQAISSTYPEARLNGAWKPRLPSNLNVSFPNLDPSTLLQNLRSTVALSSGSACSSESGKPSHVLTALGLSEGLARTSLRFGLHRDMTDEQMEAIVTDLKAIFAQMKPRETRPPRINLEPSRKS
ncbi:MAG: cysteine desulfurase family protein [Cyanobacteria bacterium J06639_1]